MSDSRLIQLDSPDAIRREAEAWDDLWRRARVTIPTARAELVAQWVEWFAADDSFRALLVQQDDRLVAALPLVGRRTNGVATVGHPTMNHWSPNGELLLDPEADAPDVLDRLFLGLRRLGWPLFRFDMIPNERPRWEAFLSALTRNGWPSEVRARWNIAITQTQGDFDAFLETRSGNLRRSLRKDLAKLGETGPIVFRLEQVFDDVEASLREAFELEHRGWKGEEGGAAMCTPGMVEFYCRQARQLAAWGDLRLATLRQNDRLIAYDLGWMGAGVYHSYKVSYDPEFHRVGPGHLLRERLLRAMFENPAVEAVDYQGPATDAITVWATGSYPISRLTFAPPTLSGRLAWSAYRAAASIVRWGRRQKP